MRNDLPAAGERRNNRLTLNMAYYSNEKIDEVKEATDLVELVSNYVNLKRAGAVYKGLCPFHSEKTPSFVVNPHLRMFHCFGCGVGGGPIQFLMRINGLRFPEAVEELARRYGVELPVEENGPLRPSETREKRTALFEVTKKANEYFVAGLWSNEGRPARRYLAGRGLTESVVRDFSLGYSLPEWDGLIKFLSGQGFGEKIMLEAGLIKPGRRDGSFYDVFRGRLMVPIIDAEGRVTAFGGRLLTSDENQPKYINSPDTPIYKKGDILYGFRRARPFLRSAGLVFVVEGYFDLISMVAGGINEVVAPLGTALTDQQLKLLRGHVERVMLLFDADEAGQRAAAKTLPKLLGAELDGRVMSLPKVHDPDTFIREFGAEALFEAAGQAVEVVDFVSARLKSTHSDTVSGQARMLREVREILAQVEDGGKRWLLARRLAQKLDLDEASLGVGKPPGRELRHQSSQLAPTVAEAKFDLTAGELLKHVLIYPETASLVLSEMAAWWPDDASLTLFRRLKDQYEQNGALNPEQAIGDDSEALAALVSKAALSERIYEPEISGQVAQEHMTRLREKWRKKKQAELSRAIKKAEAGGDGEELLRLLAEKKALLDSEK